MENTFYLIEAVPNHLDDFEVIGIFTNEDDAAAFVKDAKKSGEYLAVAHAQHLTMPVILDLLVRDRLVDLAEPLLRIVNAEKNRV